MSNIFDVPNLEKDEAPGKGYQFKDCPCNCMNRADISVDEFFKENRVLLGPDDHELVYVFSKICRFHQVLNHNVVNNSFDGYNGPMPKVVLKARDYGSGDAVCNIGYEFTFEPGHVPSPDAIHEMGRKLSDMIKRDLAKLGVGEEYLPIAMGWAVAGSDVSFCDEYGGELDIVEEFNHAVGADRRIVLSIPVAFP